MKRGPLRRIVRRTTPDRKLRRVQVFGFRGHFENTIGPSYQHHWVRVWRAWLECGHDFEMPYSQRHIKHRMRCPSCAKEETEK